MIETRRLILRRWREEDVDPFISMAADPEVMRHLNPISPADARAMIGRQQMLQDRDGYSFWALERRADKAFIGFCGVRNGGHAGTPVSDELEIGWRLARNYWGQGYAGEAAEASVAWAWANTARPRIAAWTVPANQASLGLMRRLGMSPRPELDFDHPLFSEGHPLRRHLTYILDRPSID